MTKKLTEEERVRKEYSPRGQRGQKMINFRCDLDNYNYLKEQPNRGRLLNELIKSKREQESAR